MKETNEKTEVKPDNAKVADVVEKSGELIGGADFNRLIKETIAIAPAIVGSGNFDVFENRAYLFSIGDGCGLSTYLGYFAELIASLGLRKVNNIGVIEQRLGAYEDGMNAFDNVFMVISKGGFQGVNLFCIDISEWMDKTESVYFKQFLKIIEKLSGSFIFVFRVPYIDKDILKRIEYSLSDLIFVKTVVFPPLSKDDVEKYASDLFSSYGFSLGEGATDAFFQKLAREKNEGRFYGMNTVLKVIREVVFGKLSLGGGNMITAEEMTAICNIGGDRFLSGKELLSRLVYDKKFIDKLYATVAEITERLKAGKKAFGNIKFIGNPGTGKTSVARVIGKLLAENGALTKGEIIEFEGKNLLGRYVGETSPLIASICRDAKGSILFIDNIESLLSANVDRAREALSALGNRIASHGNEFLVIMAGYADEFDRIKEICPDLSDSMPFTIEFSDFDRERLFKIFADKVKAKYAYDEGLLSAAKDYFMSLSEEFITKREFSNARFVGNLLSRTEAKAALRAELDSTDEIRLTREDFVFASKEKDVSFDIPKKTRMGFGI